MRTRNWNKLYNTYQRKYSEAVTQAQKVGIPIERMYNLYEFRATYTAFENDARAKARSSSLNVMQGLVARQKQYKLSQSQAVAIYRARGSNVKGSYIKAITEIRSGRYANTPEGKAFYHMVSTYDRAASQAVRLNITPQEHVRIVEQYDHIARFLGLTVLDGTQTVGQLFFGSN